MLAEVFVLRLEAMLRASREPTTGDTRFASNKLVVTGQADEVRPIGVLARSIAFNRGNKSHGNG
jgi:hypothetical protein